MKGRGLSGDSAHNFNWNFDVLGIAQEIRTIIGQSNNQAREGYVKALLESAYYWGNVKAKQKGLSQHGVNVMVFNLGLRYDEQFKDVWLFGTGTYPWWNGTIRYGVWVFRDGEFTNHGDGGYINWAFKGRFRRQRERGFVRFAEKFTCWNCLEGNRNVGDVEIWWGHRNDDAAWACNQWISDCNGNCTAVPK